MLHRIRNPLCLASCLLAILLASGCESETRGRNGVSANSKAAEGEQKKAAKRSPEAGEEAAAWKKAQFGENVWLATQGKKRRVIVGATVVLREGQYGLECLLCRKHTKEHESILATDADAKNIHATLLLAEAEPGSPASYDDEKREWYPAKGMRIKVLLQYEEKGKQRTVRAQEWVKNTKTNMNLAEEWVFAGSKLFPDPDGKEKPTYGAYLDGGYICIYNSPLAMLDLPVTNPNKDPQGEGREFQPNTERIPPVGTKVSIILGPEPDAKAPVKK